jgi:hypothetical protein
MALCTEPCRTCCNTYTVLHGQCRPIGRTWIYARSGVLSPAPPAWASWCLPTLHWYPFLCTPSYLLPLPPPLPIMHHIQHPFIIYQRPNFLVPRNNGTKFGWRKLSIVTGASPSIHQAKETVGIVDVCSCHLSYQISTSRAASVVR